VFENAHEDRGGVLLAVRIHSAAWTLFLGAILIVWLGVVGTLLVQRHRVDHWLNLLSALPGFALLSGYLLYPKLKFYEGGVEIPPTQDYSHARYLHWEQIERFTWEGDSLVLTGTSSLLAGGPVQGGTVSIPSAQRLAVEQVLDMKLVLR
jgi:hypothetical protein